MTAVAFRDVLCLLPEFPRLWLNFVGPDITAVNHRLKVSEEMNTVRRAPCAHATLFWVVRYVWALNGSFGSASTAAASPTSTTPRSTTTTPPARQAGSRPTSDGPV